MDDTRLSSWFSSPMSHIRKSAPSEVDALDAALAVCTFLATNGRTTDSDLESAIMLLATIAGSP